jgi:flagellar motor switch protein FliN/FliY
MSDGLSQDQVDELLASGAPPAAAEPVEELDPAERDALGEIGNICMSTAATTLSALLGNPVSITTPQVHVIGADAVREDFRRPAAAVSISYTEGLSGRSVFLLATGDAAVLADLMMGGSGQDAGDELDEMRLSAVAEAMNQMMGSSSTALAELLGRRVDIAAPDVSLLDLTDDGADVGLGTDALVRVAFELRVGELLETTLMQLLPISFARELVGGLLVADGVEGESAAALAAAPPLAEEPPLSEPPPLPPTPPVDGPPLRAVPPPVVQPVTFPQLGDGPAAAPPGDIGMLLDVPLQVTVELGRTQLRIREVLELVPGSVIELEKLAGEPVDVLVNGRQIACGEVVVIDEEFGVRITDISSQAKRLRGLAGQG